MVDVRTILVCTLKRGIDMHLTDNESANCDAEFELANEKLRNMTSNSTFSYVPSILPIPILLILAALTWILLIIIYHCLKQKNKIANDKVCVMNENIQRIEDRIDDLDINLRKMVVKPSKKAKRAGILKSSVDNLEYMVDDPASHTFTEREIPIWTTYPHGAPQTFPHVRSCKPAPCGKVCGAPCGSGSEKLSCLGENRPGKLLAKQSRGPN